MTKTDVIRYFKTQEEVAKCLTEAGYEISQAAVSQWKERIPPLRAFQLERITNGKLKADQPSSV